MKHWKDKTMINLSLNAWCRVGEQADIDEMLNFKSLVERNEGIIKNYFINGYPNAIAECISSKIKRFVLINQGTGDGDFFQIMKLFYLAPQNNI